jgi:hypothetical protein
MDQPNIDERIVNRRHDDIVLVIRHDFFIETHKNKIAIEFINEYGKKFFNLPNEILYNKENEEMSFDSILSKETSKIIQENLKDASEDEFKTKDLAAILRSISNFTILNNNFHSIIVNLKVFHIHKKNEFKRKKNIQSFYYYLIIREIDIEMKIAAFRMDFFQKLNNELIFDSVTNIPDVQSTLNELKMLIEFNKKENMKVVIALIKISENNDQTLFTSIIDQLRKEIRYNDYLGHLSSIHDNEYQLLLILHNCDLETGNKPLFRLYTSVVGNQYIFDKYKNKRGDILSIGYTQLKTDDSLEKILSRLDLAIQNNSNLTSEEKISSAE